MAGYVAAEYAPDVESGTPQKHKHRRSMFIDAGKAMEHRLENLRVPLISHNGNGHNGNGKTAFAPSAHAAHSKLEVTEVKKHNFHDERRRILKNPRTAMDVLEPYGKLHLHVKSGQKLKAADLLGSSDPFVEVFMNDEFHAASHCELMNRNPTWDFKPPPIDVWSPLSVILLKVMDYDVGTHNDMLGFVEFCVGDMHPNSTVEGHFELHHPRKLVGSSQARLRGEEIMVAQESMQKSMDEMFSHMTEELPMDMSASLGASLGKKDLGPKNGVKARSEALAHPEKSRRFSGLCRGKVPEESSSSNNPFSETPTPTSQIQPHKHFWNLMNSVVPEAGSSGTIHISMRFEASAEPGDEWYAFCFPRPVPVVYQRPMDDLPTLNLAQVNNDLIALRRCLWDDFGRNFLMVLKYIAGWQSKILSGGILLWWWVVCLYPLLFHPTLPLWLSVFLYLFRLEEWRDAMLFHPDHAALNYEGFKVIAAHRCHWRMCAWLNRVVDELLDLRVVNPKALRDLSRFLFQDGRPSPDFPNMGSILEVLRKQPWVEPKPDKGRKTSGDAAWTHIPAVFVPDKIEYTVRIWQDPLHHLQRELSCIVRSAGLLVQNDKVAGHVYKVSIYLAMFACIWPVFCSYMPGVSSTCRKVLWISAGTILLSYRCELKVLFRYLRATADHKVYLKRRDAGDGWTFLKPHETRKQVNSERSH